MCVTSVGNIGGRDGFSLPGMPSGRLGGLTGKVTLTGGVVGFGLPGMPKGRNGCGGLRVGTGEVGTKVLGGERVGILDTGIDNGIRGGMCPGTPRGLNGIEIGGTIFC